MRKNVIRIVIFPRYTTLVGGTAVFAMPMDVREFSDAHAVTWMGTGIGASPATVALVVEGSCDLTEWTTQATITPTAGVEETTAMSFDVPWIRVKATVSGGDPAVSLWMTADLVRREDSGEGEAA